jgi:hypothetical protein
MMVGNARSISNLLICLPIAAIATRAKSGHPSARSWRIFLRLMSLTTAMIEARITSGEFLAHLLSDGISNVNFEAICQSRRVDHHIRNLIGD